MICSTCKTNYEMLGQQWRYEQDVTYKVLCDVFTTATLEQLLQHALMNEVTEIYVDTFMPEHPQCDDCYLIHIRERSKRLALLEQLQFQHIEYHEFF